MLENIRKVVIGLFGIILAINGVVAQFFGGLRTEQFMSLVLIALAIIVLNVAIVERNTSN